MKKHIQKLHNTKTYSFIIVVAFAVIGATLLVFSQAATPTASFSLNPSGRSVNINTDFTVGINVNSAADQPINGVNLKLSYNTTQLTVKSITTTGTNFAACPTATGTGGTIALTCYVNPPTTLTGTNLIANVTFTAKVGSGSTTMAFINESALISKIALSGTGENIWNGVTTGGTYTLTTPDTTPPTTVITDPISTSGPLSGTKTITATAVDSASTINRVEFLVDGVLKGSDTTSPYS